MIGLHRGPSFAPSRRGTVAKSGKSFNTREETMRGTPLLLLVPPAGRFLYATPTGNGTVRRPQNRLSNEAERSALPKWIMGGSEEETDED